MKRIPRLFLMVALIFCLSACANGHGEARAAFMASIAVSEELSPKNGVSRNAELRTERTENGVSVWARWSVEAALACAAVYDAQGRMICVEGPDGHVSPWFMTLRCDPDEAAFAKLFLLDELYRPISTISATVTYKESVKKTLVAYFSATGVTRPLGGYAAEILGADLYEIVPEIPYTAADLAYYTGCRADREQADASARPAIDGDLPDMSLYDRVIIGHPIWHGQAPKIIYTFLESFDLSGKTLTTFCTSHSGGLGSSAENLKKLTPDSTVWLESRRFPSGASKSAVQNWLEEIGLYKEEKNAVGKFDFETKRVRLNSGYAMPILGLGTYSLTGQTCVDAVKAELRSGGRLIDTAYMYRNEEEVGRGVREAMEEYGIAREDIFVITKLYPNQFGDPETAIEQALSKLNIGYVDMMLLHHPGAGDVTAYKAMERYVEQGKIRSLGLSNWYVKELTDFLPQVSIPPALVQNEIHPYYQENDVVPFIQDKGIVVQCWYPLGGRGYTEDLLGNETILEIAGRRGVSSAQVILRWDLQRGIAVIPGSGNEAHIRENLDLFGFTLTQEEMDAIRALDRGEKHDWY